VRVTDSNTARDKLLMSLREVLQASAVDVTPKPDALPALELLSEHDPTGLDEAGADPHLPPTP